MGKIIDFVKRQSQGYDKYGVKDEVRETSKVGEVNRSFDTGGRTLWDDSDGNKRIVGTLEEAVIIGSELHNGKHKPTLDIDLPCRLIESSTPGHFHLYIEKEMSWGDYAYLMRTLVAVGILDESYYGFAVARRQTQLRLPWVRKK